MSDPSSRILSIFSHLVPGALSSPSSPPPPFLNKHPLSPTLFLPRAASIEPNADALVHVAANGVQLRRSYQQTADRARGLAWYLLKHRLRRVGILAPNTPAFFESIYGIVAGGGVFVPTNYRTKPDDIAYVFEFAEVDAIIVDAEYENLLGAYTAKHPRTPIIVDLDTDTISGPYNNAIAEGLAYDAAHGARGWAGLHTHPADEDDMLAIPFTSGTTSRPKGVVYTHRGAYLAALGNIIESGLNNGRCKYLWTLPMFHACGWTFPWSVAAVRGVNVCLRKIDYPTIWRLLKEEGITHFNAAPTVNQLLVAAKEAAKLPNPVRVTVAGSPPTDYLLEQMTDLNLVPVHVYGMTETYGPVTRCYEMPEWDALPRAEKYARMARQGHGFITNLPIRVVKQGQAEDTTKLVDVARDGKEVGEIVFSGNLCAREYYRDAEATRRLRAGGATHSGDLAVWHPDGSAQIIDRAKDIIISGGENISSIALESLLARHPDVLECGVVAIPSTQWGEVPKAYITVRQTSDDNSGGGGSSSGPSTSRPKLTGADVIAWARANSAISRFMVPKEVEVVAELPKTSTGKIQKKELREWAKSGRNKLSA